MSKKSHNRLLDDLKHAGGRRPPIPSPKIMADKTKYTRKSKHREDYEDEDDIFDDSDAITIIRDVPESFETLTEAGYVEDKGPSYDND